MSFKLFYDVFISIIADETDNSPPVTSDSDCRVCKFRVHFGNHLHEVKVTQDYIRNHDNQDRHRSQIVSIDLDVI